MPVLDQLTFSNSAPKRDTSPAGRFRRRMIEAIDTQLAMVEAEAAGSELRMDGRVLVAHNLRRLRVEQGITQEKLAADTRIDRAYLGGLERRTGNPTVDLLDRVAAALKVPLAALFVEPGADEPWPMPLRGGGRKA